MMSKLRQKLEAWLPTIKRVYRLFRGSRHVVFARALLLMGLALLSPGYLDYLIFVLTAVQGQPGCPPSDAGIAEIAGLFCLAAAVLVFVVFEWRERRGRGDANENEGAIALSVDEGWQFQDAVRALTMISGKPVKFTGFGVEDLSVKLTAAHSCQFASLHEALEALRDMVQPGATLPAYRVEELRGVVQLVIEESKNE